MSKKTVIIGATTNPSRYAYFAADRLTNAGHEIVPVGIKKGEVFGEEILDIREAPKVEDVDTITLYLGARHQPEYYDYLLSLNPKRIIFNPGTENPELVKLANEKGIETEYACTLVMLGSGVY
ncbi:CoA-binding protein [Marivirga tractuosa]|uniref:CoA-binding protein n=1 Tax=Marivirga tractuosa TaxID=1006 RepID=UPI0035CF6DE5